MYNQNTAFLVIQYSYLVFRIQFSLANFASISTLYTNIEYFMRTHLRNEISFVIFHIFTMLKVIFDQIWPCLVGLSYPRCPLLANPKAPNKVPQDSATGPVYSVYSVAQGCVLP